MLSQSDIDWVAAELACELNRINREERMYGHNFGFYPSIDNPCEDFRKLIDGRASGPYISIPVYIIASDRDNFGHWAAAFAVSEKRLAKKLLNPRVAQGLHPDLTVEVGSGFEVLVGNLGNSEMLRLDMQSDQLLSSEKFTQLARICEIHPAMLASVTRYWFA